MTWGECKTATLQKMAALRDNVLAETSDTAPYRDIMTAPANEGILLLTGTVCPILRCIEIEQQRQAGLPAGAGRRYDLRELAPDFRRMRENQLFFERDGVATRVAGFLLEAARFLTLPNQQGRWRVWYESWPSLVDDLTPDDEELPLEEDAARLLPLYIASQLFKDDDLGQAVQLRNEFELGLSRLAVSPSMGEDHFASVRGWY
ncbi:MAG: hypothetical protein IJC43_09165 [Clostridia bacterium]|nr:hypothetical protein [Clostridia bacterium]